MVQIYIRSYREIKGGLTPTGVVLMEKLKKQSSGALAKQAAHFHNRLWESSGKNTDNKLK